MSLGHICLSGIRQRNSSPCFIFRLIVGWVIVNQSLTMTSQTHEESRCGLAAEVLRTSGKLKLRALGVSMLPTLWPGDQLAIQSCPMDEIDAGDLVLFMRRGRFFIHRAVGNLLIGNESFLIARGDCMPGDDPPVRSSELLGRITGVQRGASSFVPGRELSTFSRMTAYLLCRWSLLRRIAMRLWIRFRASDRRAEAVPVKWRRN